jgi:hypothetical protein
MLLGYGSQATKAGVDAHWPTVCKGLPPIVEAPACVD